MPLLLCHFRFSLPGPPTLTPPPGNPNYPVEIGPGPLSTAGSLPPTPALPAQHRSTPLNSRTLHNSRNSEQNGTHRIICQMPYTYQMRSWLLKMLSNQTHKPRDTSDQVNLHVPSAVSPQSRKNSRTWLDLLKQSDPCSILAKLCKSIHPSIHPSHKQILNTYLHARPYGAAKNTVVHIRYGICFYPAHKLFHKVDTTSWMLA